jgi:hypothetical protein
MHNWLIFQYHRDRARSKSGNVGAVQIYLSELTEPLADS